MAAEVQAPLQLQLHCTTKSSISVCASHPVLPWTAAADSDKGCLTLWNISPKPCVLVAALYDEWDAQCGIEKGFADFCSCTLFM